MIAYVDSSVLLRLVLGEPRRLAEWSSIESAITSELAEVECLRTLDRLRLRGLLDESTLANRRTAVFRLLEEVSLVGISKPVLARASQPFPTSLGTLDAVHLSSALLSRDESPEANSFATHDLALAQAARSCGFMVLGA